MSQAFCELKNSKNLWPRQYLVDRNKSFEETGCPHFFRLLIRRKTFFGTLVDFFLSNAPHVLYGLRGLPSWAWQKCNRLLSLGRP